MSVTTTTTNPSQSLVLVDYELHRSDPPAVESASPDSAQRDRRAIHADAPRDWPTDHRRVPAYRPVNTHLDLDERIVFSNRGEQAFIRTMFFGIQVVTAFHRTWTATGARLNNRAFCYAIGGEY